MGLAVMELGCMAGVGMGAVGRPGLCNVFIAMCGLCIAGGI